MINSEEELHQLFQDILESIEELEGNTAREFGYVKQGVKKRGHNFSDEKLLGYCDMLREMNYIDFSIGKLAGGLFQTKKWFKILLNGQTFLLRRRESPQESTGTKIGF